MSTARVNSYIDDFAQTDSRWHAAYRVMNVLAQGIAEDVANGYQPNAESEQVEDFRYAQSRYSAELKAANDAADARKKAESALEDEPLSWMRIVGGL
jgi:hypothetical protein